MVRFLAQETASGILLLVATAAALIWANLPGEWGESYHVLWETHVEMDLGSWVVIDKSLEALVNDALMVLFFFVVGLEIKSELVVGDLSSRRVAALPAIAALGGMVARSHLCHGDRRSGRIERLGCADGHRHRLRRRCAGPLGPSIPQSLKLFLLTLAIVDDIGAILVIAAFYTRELQFTSLAAAVILWVLVVVLTRYKVWFTPVYAVIGVVLWYATFRSGVHATIAGVALGLATPAVR